jgi:hypothetical protein
MRHSRSPFFIIPQGLYDEIRICEVLNSRALWLLGVRYPNDCLRAGKHRPPAITWERGNTGTALPLSAARARHRTVSEQILRSCSNSRRACSETRRLSLSFRGRINSFLAQLRGMLDMAGSPIGIRLHHPASSRNAVARDGGGGPAVRHPSRAAAPRRILAAHSAEPSVCRKGTYPNVVRGVIGICGGLPGDWDDGAYRTVSAAVLHIARRQDNIIPRA